MIDPHDLKRPVPNVTELLLFATMVHGKNARVQAGKLNAMLEGTYELFPQYDGQPLAVIRALSDDLEEWLRGHGAGQYGRLVRTWGALSSFADGHRFTVGELEGVFGIGPKTARFVVGYAYDEPVAILDVHVLRFLRSLGVDAPHSTPQDPAEYARLETEFLKAADATGVHPLDLDLSVWKEGANRRRVRVAA